MAPEMNQKSSIYGDEVKNTVSQSDENLVKRFITRCNALLAGHFT